MGRTRALLGVLMVALAAPSAGSITPVDVRTTQLDYNLMAYAVVNLEKAPTFRCNASTTGDSLEAAHALGAMELSWGEAVCATANDKGNCERTMQLRTNNGTANKQRNRG